MLTYLGPNFDASINSGKHDYSYNEGESVLFMFLNNHQVVKSHG